MPKNDEEEMTKYAVDEGADPDTLEKVSSEGCPRCGNKCKVHGKIIECPVHGTEPFEK